MAEITPEEAAERERLTNEELRRAIAKKTEEKAQKTKDLLAQAEKNQPTKPLGKEPAPPETHPLFRQQSISVAGERLRKITGEPSETPKQPERRTPEEIIRAAFDKSAKPGPSALSSEDTGISPVTRVAKEKRLPPKIF